MAYTTIDKPTDYFNTKLYTGDGNSTQAITGVGFEPNWIWVKNRSDSTWHQLIDSVRGVGAANTLASNSNEGDGGGATNQYGFISAIGSDGFTVSAGTSNASMVNHSGNNYTSWNWLAGGSAPAITYSVKVVSDSGNKYRFDDFGTSAVTLDLQEGGTYTFDQSDSSNSGHPLRFYTAADKSGGEYTTGVTTSGTAGSAGAKTIITVAASAPTLYYQCSSHSAMGGQANTNSTFGSSNFGGSIQANVSANTTAGFSIIRFSGTGSLGTVAHGLGVKPSAIFFKRLDTNGAWASYHEPLGATKYMRLDSTSAQITASDEFNDTEPTSTVFTVDTDGGVNASGTNNMIAYCFADVKGYSKVSGSYVGNGSTSGTYVHLGFKPAFVLLKNVDEVEQWWIFDNKRNAYDGNFRYYSLNPNHSSAEGTNSADANHIDFLSNGFKLRTTAQQLNGTSDNFIYLAFAESPFVTSTGIPTTAR